MSRGMDNAQLESCENISLSSDDMSGIEDADGLQLCKQKNESGVLSKEIIQMILSSSEEQQLMGAERCNYLSMKKIDNEKLEIWEKKFPNRFYGMSGFGGEEGLSLCNDKPIVPPRTPGPELMGDDCLTDLEYKMTNRTVDEIVATPGIVERFVEFIARKENYKLQIEALSFLRNIICATSHQKHKVPIVIELLGSDSNIFRMQALQVLAHIAKTSRECMVYILDFKLIPSRIPLLAKQDRLTMRRKVMWTQNLCKSRNALPDINKVSPGLKQVSRLLCGNDTVSEACWALMYLMDGSKEKIQLVINSGVCGRLVELLLHRDYMVVYPALRIVGNIVTGNCTQTQVILTCSVLHSLSYLLRHLDESIREGACWTISNIVAGKQTYIQMVIDADLLPPLISILKVGKFQVRKMAALAIANITCCGSAVQIRHLVELGCIKPLCDLLILTDSNIVQVALIGLGNILGLGELEAKQGKEINPYCSLIEEASGPDKLMSLQGNKKICHKICRNALDLITYYFRPDDAVLAVAIDLQQQELSLFQQDEAFTEGLQFCAPKEP